MQDTAFVHDSFVVFQNPYISLMTVGWEKCEPCHSCASENDTYIIHFVKSGKGTFFIDNKLHHLKANDAFLIRPNQKAEYAADAKEPWHYCYFSFSGVMASVFLDETVFRGGNSVCTLQSDAIFGIIEECLINIRKSKSAKISTLEYLFRMLSELVFEQVYVKEDKNLLIKQVDYYIRQNYMRDIQISEIANQFNISRNYLFRIFKKENGVSLKSYILNVRFLEAKRLLVTTNLPIMRISEMLGFKTYSSFFKLFKTNIKCTPKEYRELIKHTDENFAVFKSGNGIYQIESEVNSLSHKEKYNTKI